MEEEEWRTKLETSRKVGGVPPLEEESEGRTRTRKNLRVLRQGENEDEDGERARALSKRNGKSSNFLWRNVRKCRVVKINCLKRAVPRHRFLRFGVSTHTVLTFDIFEEVMMGCGPGSRSNSGSS